MPPKGSKNEDIKTVIDLVKGFWPDFNITSELLTNPTTQFVQSFFNEFLSDINEKIRYLLGDEIVVEHEEFDGEVQLFCAVSKIFKKLKVDTFCINDINTPVPLRTRFFIKSAIHFLIYITNEMSEWEHLICDSFKKAQEQNKLKENIQEFLEELQEHLEAVEKGKDEHTKLLEQKDSVDIEYEKMLNEKHAREKLYAQKQLEIDQLRREIENQEYRKNCLEQEEANLQEQVITEKDFEVLQNMKRSLKEELERLSSNDAGLCDGLAVQKENIDFIESCAQYLKKLNCDSLFDGVHVLQKTNDALKTGINKNSELRGKLNSLQATVDKTNAEIEILNQKLASTESKLHLLHTEIENDFKAIRVKQDIQREITLNKIKQAAELKKTISCLKEDISNTEQRKERFKEAVALEYMKVLDSTKDYVNTACSVFEDIYMEANKF